MVDPPRQATERLFHLLQTLNHLLSARETVDEDLRPIGTRGKAADKQVNGPEVDDGCMGCEQTRERLRAIKIECEDVPGAVLEHECEPAAAAVLVEFAHLFGADDAGGGWACQGAQRRDYPVTCDAAQLRDRCRQRRSWQMVQDGKVAQDDMKLTLGPGQRVEQVVLQELEPGPVAFGDACQQALGTPSSDVELACRDIETDSLDAESLPMRVCGNSPQPGAGAAAG
ncbi:MAG TPA: hypothetical protein VG758_15395, partial [Hyphomicrobiaceae bacterium]|nr:hypothetical protein [Hyphomicrobiaceae bacterium]